MQQNKESITRPQSTPEHAYSLLQPSDRVIDRAGKLHQQSMLLAFVKENQLIRLYQNDFILLESLFDMTRRDKENTMGLCFLHEYLYNGWIGELNMTRTKDGLERGYQALVAGAIPPRDMSGYGYEEVKQQQRDARDMGNEVRR